VVGLEELEGDEDDDGLRLAHLHLLGRGDVEVLQVCLPLGVVGLCFSGWGKRGGREGGREGRGDGQYAHWNGRSGRGFADQCYVVVYGS